MMKIIGIVLLILLLAILYCCFRMSSYISRLEEIKYDDINH